MTQEIVQQTGSTPPPNGGTGFLFPPRAALVRTSETIINPERRAATESSSVELLPAPSSALCGVLFPNPEAIQQSIPNPAGVELGHFRIQCAIRSGGMGAVFEALDTRLNRIVALKVLPPSQSRDISAVQRFRNEAQAAAQLDHDNIARVFYIGEDKALHFIAFEFIRGTNLREIVQQKGKLTPAEAVNYTLQIASALAHAAEHGVVHRDIKPSNIIVMPSGRAKLVDLGLARSEHRENEPDLTVAGTTLGTFDYISPEQAKDPRTVDVRSDIYSLGCTLYHLLTGEPPYPQGTVLQKLLDHQGKDAPDPRLKNRRVSAELASIVKMMMASDVRKRYQTAGELIRDLLFVANSLGLKSINSEGLMWLSLQNSPDSFWERHSSWLAMSACLLMFVGYLQFFGYPPSQFVSSREVTQNTEGNPFELRPESPETTAEMATNAATDTATTTIRPIAGMREPPSPTPFTNDSTPTVIGDTAEHGDPSSDTSLVKEPDEQSDDLTQFKKLYAPPGDDERVIPRPLVPQHPMGLVQGPPEITSTSTQKATPSLAKTETDQEDHVPPAGSKPTTVVAVVPTTSNDSASLDNAISREPTVAKPQVEAVSQFPIVLLKSDGTPEQVYPTLEAACAIAQDGNVIELRFNGPRSESPVRIRNKITIRAGKGYHPVIEFVPKDIPASGYETRMMTLTGGSLDLIDIGVLIKVKELISTDGWFLISTRKADAVRLQRVVITVENTARRPTAVFEFRGGASRMVSDMEMPGGTNQMSPSMTVRLADSMVRGGTDLFHVKSILNARLDVENCLLVLDGTLLRQSGTMDVPEKQTELTMRLYQLTAIVNSGLIVMESGDMPRQLGRVLVDAANNIFATPTPPANRPVAPLIMMTGNEPSDDLRKLVVWSGQKNFYDGFQSFWTTNTLVDGPRTSIWDFEEWKYRLDSNEIDPLATNIKWKNVWRGRLFTELTPMDFTLDDNVSENPALSAANNGEDAGINLSTLEKLYFPPRQRTPEH